MTEQFLENDPDLASLHADPRMRRLKEAMRLASSPCDTLAHAREFDFWIGDWEVYAQGTRVGTNEIQRVSNGCALLENWTAITGNQNGKSINFYNPAIGQWQQTWVGSGGGITEYREGVLRDSTLTFLASATGPTGQPARLRLSFTRLSPNRVRQHSEGSSDGGATWTTLYDFTYIRRGSGERP
jgi:hypothetical protein